MIDEASIDNIEKRQKPLPNMCSPLPACPRCGSDQVVKNGSIHNGKQNHRCKICGRQFVENPENKTIDAATKQLIDKLLLEDLSLAGIARVTDVSELWLQNYVKRRGNLSL